MVAPKFLASRSPPQHFLFEAMVRGLQQPCFEPSTQKAPIFGRLRTTYDSNTEARDCPLSSGKHKRGQLMKSS